MQGECRSLDEHEVGKRDSVTLRVRKLCIAVWRARGPQSSCGRWGGCTLLWSAPLWVPRACSASYQKWTQDMVLDSREVFTEFVSYLFPLQVSLSSPVSHRRIFSFLFFSSLWRILLINQFPASNWSK